MSAHRVLGLGCSPPFHPTSSTAGSVREWRKGARDARAPGGHGGAPQEKAPLAGSRAWARAAHGRAAPRGPLEATHSRVFHRQSSPSHNRRRGPVCNSPFPAKGTPVVLYTVCVSVFSMSVYGTCSVLYLSRITYWIAWRKVESGEHF